MTEHITRADVYIPETGTKWPEKPDQPVLFPKKLREVVVDGTYPFLDKSLKSRLRHTAVYAGIFTLVFLLQHIRYGIRFVGKENLRRNKKLFKDGALTVCNHVYRWDFLAVVQAVRKVLWFPARAENLGGSDEGLIRGAGGIPVTRDFAGNRKFYEAFDELHSKKQWIHVFPEGCRWQWYSPIRPFKRGAFEFAHRYNIPVIPTVITYRRPGPLRRLLGVKHPLITLHIGEPLLTDQNLSSKKDSVRLREICHRRMCEMAGIIRNKWPCGTD